MIEPSYYGETLADIYDDLYQDVPARAIETLTELVSPGGKVLELGIGTGRFAIPLIKSGLQVTGVDASPSMLEILKKKPEGRDIPVFLDDFAKLEKVSGGPFELAFCNFSSFFLLPSQQLQLDTFFNTARLLTDGGRLVLETFYPDTARYYKDQPPYISDFKNDSEVMFEASRHDSVNQKVSCRFVRICNNAIRIIPVEIRYCWPSELDLMARLSGMRLESRWAGWDKSEFMAGAFKHISVYQKTGLPG